jgi:transposase
MRPFLMGFIQGADRGQAALLPAAIEDYVAADAPVRVIDAFVDGLDLGRLRFGRASPAAPRPGRNAESTYWAAPPKMPKSAIADLDDFES